MSSVCKKEVIRGSGVQVTRKQAWDGVYSNNTWRNEAAQQRSSAVCPSYLPKTGSPSGCGGSSWHSPLLPIFACSPCSFFLLWLGWLTHCFKQLLPFPWFGTPLPQGQSPCTGSDLAVSRHLWPAAWVWCGTCREGPWALACGQLPFILNLGCITGA